MLVSVLYRVHWYTGITFIALLIVVQTRTAVLACGVGVHARYANINQIEKALSQ